MNVLIVSSNFPPDVGGPAVSANYLSQELIKNGIKTHILTNGTKKNIKDPKYVIRTAKVDFEKNSIIGAFLRIIDLFKELTKIGKKYDIIISQDTNISGLPVFLASFFNKKPYIVKFSGDLAVEYLADSKEIKDIINEKMILSKILHFIQKIICNNSKYVIATSEYVKNCVKKIGVDNKKIIVIPNGIIKQKIDPKIVYNIRKEYGKNLICTACRLVKWKNVDFLVNIMKKLPKYKLIIYGDGPKKEEIKNSISKQDIKNVVLYGSVDYKKIQSYIKPCKVFILSSTYEPFGIALLDAIIAGVPVLVSNVGGMPEIAKNNGVIFKENDEQDFIKQLENIKHVKNMNIKKYEWNNIIKLYKQIISE